MKAEKKATSSLNKKHAQSTSINQLLDASQTSSVEPQESVSTPFSNTLPNKKTRLQQHQQKQMFNEAAVRNNFYVNIF